MLLTDIDLHEVNESVWTSMLGFELAATEVEPADPTLRYLIGSVTITGGWDAAVMVQIPVPFAIRLAATMFGFEETEIGDAEVADALGEMANMVGGNVKGMLPGDSSLSLPTVLEGSDLRWSIPGGALVSDTFYRCELWTIRTTLFGRTA